MLSISEPVRSVESAVDANAARGAMLPAVFAAALGLMLLYAAGFAETEALHNAAHDVRHTAAIPCH